MSSTGQIHRISISEHKGDKKNNVGRAMLTTNFGIVGDAHAGSDRQVSLLPFESFSKLDNDQFEIKPGDFAENLTTVNLDFSEAAVGRRILIGTNCSLEITQIGKECHQGCRISQVVGDCIMPHEGVFAKVLGGGQIKIGDSIRWA